MSGSKSIFIFINLFICVFTQYYGYPSYPYGYGGNYRSYPVTNQGNYGSSPCRSSCGNIQPTSYCQHLPCYAQQQQQQQSYYPFYNWPYPSYNSRSYSNPYNNYYGNSKSYSNPYVNYYSNSQQNPDPYANIPVEIIDDDSVVDSRLGQRIPSNKQDEYANVPVEIIDDDTFTNSWKDIPVLPRASGSSHSNYSVSHGAVTSNSVTQSKPVKATITRSFQPLKQNPDFRIDFLNGVPLNGAGRPRSVNENKTNEEVTVKNEETTDVPSTESNEITEKESEEVAPVKSFIDNFL